MLRAVSTNEADGSALGGEALAALYQLTDRLYRAGKLADVFDAALDAIAATLGCDRASVLLFDAQGVMRFVAWRGLSESYRSAVDGHSPWQAGQRDALPIYVSDILATDEPHWLKKVVAAEGIRGLSFIPLEAHGEVVGKFMTYFRDPHVSSQQEMELAVTIARQVGFAIEGWRARDARKTAERELRLSEQRQRIAVDAAGLGVFEWDAARDAAIWENQRMFDMFGHADNDPPISMDVFLTSYLHPDDREHFGDLLRSSASPNTPFNVTCRIFRKGDRALRWLEVCGRFEQNGPGEQLRLVGVIADVTERRQLEAHRELLINELNHRVKNTLAVVQSLARQTFRRSDPVALMAFDGRLQAVAHVHNLLAERSWNRASLLDVARRALLARGGNNPRIRIRGAEIDLSAKQAVTMAMTLHELFTNATKYGALSNDKGTIDLQWKTAGDELRISWEERGGPPCTISRKTGFGTLLIQQGLRAELEAVVDMDFRQEGLLCTIRMPLHRLGTAAA